MARVLVPLAEGCEELEAVTVIDLLRRAGIEVISAGLEQGSIKASRGMVLVPDMTLDQALDSAQADYDMVVLPGGLPGADHLNNDSRIQKLITEMNQQQRYVAAICAAPKVLARAGLLNGRKATAYPGVLQALAVPGLSFQQETAVVVDEKVITSRGPGTAMNFALTLIEILVGQDKRDEVEQGLCG
ncbi:MAG TPA: DJ-1/PfpI family protein [Gammaproteobacteria bacterium]|nr:DJ-1/PfpI family protein [Gammaproteobacteria bacterium]